MNQIIFASTSSNTDANNHYNNPLIMRVWDGFLILEVTHRTPILVPGTFKNWKIRRSAAPAVGTSVSYTLRKNGVDTALVVTVNAGSLTGQNTSDTVSFNKYDEVSLRCNYSGSPGAASVSSAIEFESSGGNDSIYGLTTRAGAAPSDLQFASVFNGDSEWTSSAAQATQVLPISGSLVEYKVKLDSAPGSGNSVQISIYKNGVKQDGSGGTVGTRVTVSDSATTGIGTFDLAFVPDDYVYLQCDYTGTSGISISMGFRFTPIEANQYLIASITPALGTSALTNYSSPTNVGSEAMDLVESVKYQTGGVNRAAISKMYVRASAAPAGSATRNFRLRKNSSNENLNVTLTTGQTGNDQGGTVNIQPSDLFDIRHISTGSPVTANVAISFAVSSGAVVGIPFRARAGSKRIRFK